MSMISLRAYESRSGGGKTHPTPLTPTHATATATTTTTTATTPAAPAPSTPSTAPTPTTPTTPATPTTPCYSCYYYSYCSHYGYYPSSSSLLQLMALVTSVCAGRCQQYYWADAMGRIMVTSPTCLPAGKDMECQKYRDKYCGNCVKHHTYKETAVELQHFKTNHSPTTRSISEAPAQDTQHRHISASQRTTTSHSPCTRSISQAHTHDRNEMYLSHEDLRQNKPFPM